MKRAFLLAILYLAISIAATRSSGCPAAEPAVYFSPKGGCTQAVVDELARAKKTVRVQAYNFTSPPIVAALIAAHGRGVDVQLCLDARAAASKGNAGRQCAAAGLPTFVDAAHPIAHSKVMIIDGETLVTGSFNFSKQAEKNLENLLVIHDAGLAAKYLANWSEHQKHCQPLGK